MLVREAAVAAYLRRPAAGPMPLPRPLLVVLIVLNAVVLLGQLWPAGAPPLARVVNVGFLAMSLAAFVALLACRRPPA